MGYRIPILSLCFAAIGVANAADTRLVFSDLPPAVQATATRESAGAQVRGYAKEVENGKISYEVQLTQNRKTKDLSIDPDGNILEVEQQVDLTSLPVAVRTGLINAAGQGKIVKVESITNHAGDLSYEAAVDNGGKHSEVVVDRNGKPGKRS